MIREAVAADVPLIVSLGQQFHAASPYAWIPADPTAFGDFAGRLIEHGVIYLSDDGMIGGCISPYFFNPAVMMAAELFWFAREDGRALRETFEAWARGRGATAITCAGLVNDREPAIRKLYARAGYQPAEVSFFKRLEP